MSRSAPALRISRIGNNAHEEIEMFKTRPSYHRSAMIFASGLALAGAASMGCDAEVAELTSLSQPSLVPYTPVQDTWTRRTATGPVDWGLSHELRTNNVDVAEHPEAILVRFPIDLGLVCPTLVNATLSLQSAQLIGPLQVYAHRITSAWTPGNTGAVPPVLGCEVYSGDPAPFDPPTFLPPSAATLVNDHCTRFSWDVTTIVNAWCAGAPNQGIWLDGHRPDDTDVEVNFFSMEAAPGRRPLLEITY